MVDITFTNPAYLWVLIIVPFLIVIHFFTLKQSRAAVIKFANFEAIERVASGEVLATPYRSFLRNKNVGLLFLRAIVYCILILAVAGTTISYKGKTSTFDYVFALDASSSMLADDFKPTRFDAAKDAAGKFIDFVPSGANVGIVTFASTTIIEERSNSNLQEVRDTISDIELHQSGGTAIGDAIITGTNLFNTNKSKTMILLTDGQNNVGTEPEVAIEYAKQNVVLIHTIGVATEEGGTISSLKLVSRLDETLLRRISDETGGRFFLAQDIKGLTEAFRQIASSNEQIIAFNISWILLISVVVLLGIEWILVNTIYKTVP